LGTVRRSNSPPIPERSQVEINGGFSDYHDDVHYTTSVNDSSQFTFRGTGVQYIAEKHTEFRNVDLYIDGKLKQNMNLHSDNFPRLSRVVVFRIEGLSDGLHTIKIVNKSAAGTVLDAFRVYGGRQ
jgi:hypothetical protein